MFTLKHIIFFIVVFILFNLNRFYMLPIYLPLDSKPLGTWSASYLAKSIARDAGCTIDFMGDGAFWEEGTTIFNFNCTMPNIFIDFEIYVFLNKKLKNAFLNEKKELSNHHSHCFKKGPYYVICGHTGEITRRLNKPYKNKEPKLTNINSQIISSPLRGEQFYQKFPGEDINITVGF